MFNIYLTIYAVFNFHLVFALAPTDVLVLIFGQDGSSYHRQLSEALRKSIQDQASTLTTGTTHTIRVRLLNALFSHPGDWTLLTALSHLYDGQFTPPLINENTKWIILCEESTHVDIRILLDRLAKENYQKASYIGFPLYDQEATIIHHFAFFENPKWFPYPMLRAGVVFTVSLLKSLAAAVAGRSLAAGSKLPTRTSDFSIDAAHELARFMLNHVRNIERNTARLQVATKGQASSIPSEKIPPTPLFAASLETTSQVYHLKNERKIVLQKVPYICPKAPTNAGSTSLTASATFTTAGTHKSSSQGAAACAMYAKPMETAACVPIERHEIFFAVKTCHKFHAERIPIIEATWAPYAVHKRFYSDKADDSAQTIDTGIPNADTGHCSKTLAILKLALKDIEQMNRELKSTQSGAAAAAVGGNFSLIRWLLLSDDDTLLSVSHLSDLLGCFNHSEMVYLGERYGYRLHAEDGFNYITGGGGIVFSLPVVNMIITHCTCPATASPDDMILGACLHTLGVKALHSSRFHQARPNDYPRELLQLEPPISFHKFWQLDPLQVYDQWFAAADRGMLSSELQQNKSYQRSTKQRMRLKKPVNSKDKSRYAAALAQSCKSRAEENESKTSKMEVRNELPLGINAAAFEQENSSHLDL